MPSANHPRVAVAGIPGAKSSEALRQALIDRGAAGAFVLPLADCAHDLQSGTIHWREGPIGPLDGVGVKKLGDAADVHVPNRLNMLREIERSGAIVMSSPDAIEAAINRYRMSWILARAGVPTPETQVTDSPAEARRIVERWGKAVLKPLFTSHGRGMLVLTPEEDCLRALEAWRGDNRGPFYLQQFVEAPGRDGAVAVLGGRIIGAYSRVAKTGEWMTTTAAGGHYEPFDPPPEAVETALDAALIFDLDYTTVDLVQGPQGWLVYEVSAFGGFTGLKATSGVDAAGLYAAYALERIAKGEAKG